MITMAGAATGIDKINIIKHAGIFPTLPLSLALDIQVTHERYRTTNN